MALADAPRPPVVAATRSRPRAVLEDQKAVIRLALRSLTLDDDQRELPIVLPGRGEPVQVQRSRRTEAPFAPAVHALLDALPKHVLVHLPHAVATLPLEGRLLLLLRVQQGHTQCAVREALGLPGRPSVDARVDAVLGQLARLLWQDSGGPRVPG